MNKEEIFQLLFSNAGEYTLQDVLLNLAATFLVVMFIFFIYRITSRGVLFNSNFGFVIVLTGLITAVIMMVIESNLALSLGMVGALSIVRFRSAIKDPRDTGFIFWSVAAGLAAGTANYSLAFFSTLAIGVFVIIYSLITKLYPTQLLIIHAVPGNGDLIRRHLAQNKIRFRQKMQECTADHEEHIFEVRSKDAHEVVDALLREGIAISANLIVGNEE